MKGTKTFDLTNYNDLRDYTELINNCAICVTSESDFFGVGKSEDGPVPCIIRVVDYRERDDCTASVYQQPVC